MNFNADMNDAEFTLYQQMVYEICGINLTWKKKNLLISRLEKRVRELGLASFRVYREYVTRSEHMAEQIRMVDLITTNKTDFFREPAHFDFLKNHVYPRLFKKGSIRIWSAGCSSGEEPYTLAITLFEERSDIFRQDIKILATDICTEVLDRAEQGIYQEERVSKIPRLLIKKYFLKGVNKWNGCYTPRDELKKIIRFRRLNFMEPFPFHGEFDFIFCRNVMIYFDKPTQTKLVKKFIEHLAPGGFFFIGHSENLTHLKTGLKYVRPTIYQKV